MSGLYNREPEVDPPAEHPAASKQLHWLEKMERIEQEVFPDARPRSEVVVPCTCPAHEARPQTDPDCPIHGGAT